MKRLAYSEMATLMRLTVLYFPQKPDRSAIFSENEQADFQRSCWSYGEYQWCHLLAEEENPENGGDAERETLNIVNDRAGAPYFVDKEGEYWRAYLFIEDATCFDQVENDEDFYQSALAFGNFQRLLADYPADTLHETIPDFHNTVKRFANFKRLWKRMHADGRLMFRRRYSLSWKESSWPIHLWIYRMQVSCLFV